MTAPASAPTIDGIASARPFAGRVTAAAAPIAPSTTDPTMPRRGRRPDAAPSTATTTVSTIPIPIRRATLSCSPNVRIANDFSHSGLASTATPPTATIGEDPGPNTAASSSAVPSATAAASTPIVAPAEPRREGRAPSLRPRPPGAHRSLDVTTPGRGRRHREARPDAHAPGCGIGFAERPPPRRFDVATPRCPRRRPRARDPAAPVPGRGEPRHREGDDAQHLLRRRRVEPGHRTVVRGRGGMPGDDGARRLGRSRRRTRTSSVSRKPRRTSACSRTCSAGTASPGSS